MTKKRMSPIMFFLLASFAVYARTLSETVPGTVVHHSPASSGVYIGSPGIILLPNGNLIAKCDEFGPKSTENGSAKTIIFVSRDQGHTWTKLSELNDMYWATIFRLDDALYLLGNHKQYGDIVLSRSTDEGKTWSFPRDHRSGRLRTAGQYHCAPVPVLIYSGRIWRAMERMAQPNRWGTFEAGVISAPLGADLLNADNWTCTNWLPMPPGHPARHWLEGNVLATPEGKVVNVLRSGFQGAPERAMVLHVSKDGRRIVLNKADSVVDMPGASDKKFTIRFDPESRQYWALANPMLPSHQVQEPGRVRNTLALVSSPDLKKWVTHAIVAYHPDVHKHGFQYPDWVFDGRDIVAAVRTAHEDGQGGAHNFHDANYLTFHRILNFREIGEAHTRQVMAPWITNPEKRNVPVPSDLPGVVIDHSPASSGIYLGSPAIAVLPNGDYIAKCDEFGPKSSQNSVAVSRFYRSSDTGQTWEHISTVKGLFWASLFVHRNSVYAMGTDSGGGNVVIRKSDDGGRTWTQPDDENTGLLLSDAKYHCAPVPLVVHNGRIWRAMEDVMGPGGWGSFFRAFMMSAPVDADLLKADSWTCSNRLGRNPAWLDSHFGGWLEGNAVIDPNGEVVNILRVDYREEAEKAAIMRVSPDGTKITFDPASGFIDFPGGCKKFTIRFDPTSGLYWTLSNAVLPRHRGGNPERTRNAVALMASADLRTWNIRSIVLYHPDVHKHGFQYLDWLFEGNDIIAASRTAWDDGQGGADNQHNANFLTFHRIEGFRTLQDSPETLAKWHIQKPQYGSPEEHLVARWDFETGRSPLEDTAPAGQYEDVLRQLGQVAFEDGIAKFPAGAEGIGLQAVSSPDLSPAAEMTLWLRFRLNGKPQSYMSLVDKRQFAPQQRSYGLFITPDAGTPQRFAIGGQVSSAGTADGALGLTKAPEELPVDLWVQAVLVVRVEEESPVAEWYYRTEDTDGRNPWKQLGQSRGGFGVFQSDVPLTIGNNINLGALPVDLWIDEVRLYDRALSMEELGNCWALLGGSEDVPSRVPGVVIDHSPAESKIYLGAPAIVILPDGTYVAKCQETGPGAPRVMSRIYRSDDKGASWQRICTFEGVWMNLFVHDDDLYAMGTDKAYGSVIIRKSTDGGKTWSKANDKMSGLLLDDAKYHTAPVPVVEHNGRIWRAMEDAQGSGGWGSHFRAFMMSAPIGADLLRADSWTCSNRLGRNPNWLDEKFGGWLEGNAIVTPAGEIVNLLRVDYRPDGGKAATIHVSPDGKTARFNPDKDFIHFPGGCKKFTVRYDPESKLYWTLSNAILPKHRGGNPERTRNAVALMSSANLQAWKIRDIVLYHPDVHKHGFQYLDWCLEGEDIIAVSRTAYDDGLGGADNQHNANYFTFHRIERFRDTKPIDIEFNFQRAEIASIGSLKDGPTDSKP